MRKIFFVTILFVFSLFLAIGCAQQEKRQVSETIEAETVPNNPDNIEEQFEERSDVLEQEKQGPSQAVQEQKAVPETIPKAISQEETTITIEAAAGTAQTETPENESGQTTAVSRTTNPIDELSNGLINRLGASCKDKNTEFEKADCILSWQEKNLFWCYTHPEETVMPNMFETGYPDCVVDMQFQQMMPGSFPASKTMEIKIRNKKIFGACYTYAVTYCAIARWNGLKCRVMESENPAPQKYSASEGDYGQGYCGAAQKSYLDALGLDCEEWKKIDWTIGSDHYWAEVQIGGSWKMMEKPTWAYKRDTQKYIIDSGRKYHDTGW